MADAKRGTRTRGYVKTQQYTYDNRGWSSSTTYTGGWWLFWKGLLPTFATPFSQEIIDAPHP